MHRIGIALIMLLSVFAMAFVPPGENTVPAAADGSTSKTMTLTQALVLGVVEGLTEFLPVSSTGHLILTQRLMGIGQSVQADAFVMSIQIGGILAVAGIFWPYLRKLLAGVAGRSADGRRLLVNLLVAFAPAALAGYLLKDVVGAHLFGLWPIIAAWWFGGMAILIVAAFSNRLPKRDNVGIDSLTWKQALVIGLIQCTAIWPGTSRSLVTILGGILVGMETSAAVVFSFLLGAVTLSAVCLYEFARHGTGMMEAYGGYNILAGVVAAFLSAALAVKWMVRYLQRHSLAIFGWYRVVLAIVAAILLIKGVMEPR